MLDVGVGDDVLVGNERRDILDGESATAVAFANVGDDDDQRQSRL